MIQNRLFLFQEAMNTDTASSIDPQELSLGPREQYIPKTPVSDTLPRYKQTVMYKGCKVCIQVPASQLFALIYSSKAMYGDAVLVPVTQWLREQFAILDTFLERNVRLPNELTLRWSASLPGYYKSIYNGNNIFIFMSKYCRFTQEVNGNLIDLPSQPRPNFGKGRYAFTIEVPDVYIGPHKSGHLYSPNLRVTHIHFQSVASNDSSAFVQNYAMPVSQPMSVEKCNPHFAVRIMSPIKDLNSNRTCGSMMSSGMDIGPDSVSHSSMSCEKGIDYDRNANMAGMLPTKPKRRRKAVISE